MVKYTLGILKRDLDPQSYEVVGSGQGKDKSDIYSPNYNHAWEIKNQKNINVQRWLKEAEQDSLGRRFAVVWREPNTPETNPVLWVGLDFGNYLQLLRRNRESEPLSSKQVKYHLKKAIEELKKVVRIEPD